MTTKTDGRKDEVLHLLLLSLTGFGHVNPILQLGRRFLEVASTTDFDLRVSVIINLNKEDRAKLSVAQLEESENFKVLIKDFEANDLLAALNWYCDLDEEEVIRIYGGLVEGSMKTHFWPRPRMIIQDQFFYIGYVLAQEWNIPYLSFAPTPLIYNYYSKSVIERFQERKVRDILERDEPMEMLSAYNTLESLEIPGLGLIPKSSLPKATNLRAMGEMFLRAVSVYLYASGIVSNDVESASHPDVIKYLRKHIFGDTSEVHSEGTSDNKRRKPPPELKGGFDVYCVGPLCLSDARLTSGTWSDNQDVKDWLDLQPRGSVLFVCLGSWCDICESDLVEVARGLQMSGKAIVWSYRPIMGLKRMNEFLSLESNESRQAAEELDEETRLPLGYVKEVQDQILIKQWVNQPEILKHEAVGSFMTHCGWNSISEAVSIMGKPVIGLPVAAEQCMNARWICDVHEAGIRLWESRQTDKLDRNNISNAIKEIFTNPKYAQNAIKLHKKFKHAAQTESASNIKTLLNRLKLHYNDQ